MISLPRALRVCRSAVRVLSMTSSAMPMSSRYFPLCWWCRCVVVIRWIASIRRRAARVRLQNPLIRRRSIALARRPTKRVTFQHWFASDGLGIIVVAPLIIEFASAARDRPPLAELLEGTLTVAVLALVSALAIFLRSDLLANVGPVAVLFAPLLWLSARCQPVFAAAAAFIVSLSIVWTTTFGIGYFGNPTLS